MLKEKDYKEIKKELDASKNPIYFFDDDPDGLSSFLLLYRYLKEGHGLPVKTHPKLDSRLVPKVEEYAADKVFVLDVAMLEQDFIDKSPAPVIWIDHHGPFDRHNVKYFNPRTIKQDVYIPTSYLCYRAVKQDLWIAMTGCIGDMYLPEFSKEFKKKYPELSAKKNDVREYYFNSKVGQLIKTFSFCLKGKTSDVKKNIKVLTRINEPEEILEGTTPGGNFIKKRYEKINKMYESLLADALKEVDDSKVLMFAYSDEKMSFTGDLANELLYKYPDKIVIIGRRKDEDMRMSIRSSNIPIPPLLDKALVGLEGYGGGHENACGANVKQHDFNEFLERLKKLA